MKLSSLCDMIFYSILIPFVFTLDTCIKNCGCLICTSGLSLLIISLGIVAFWTQSMCNWKLFHPLIFLNNFKFFIMHICHDIFLLSCQIVIISASITYQPISCYWRLNQQNFIAQWTELHLFDKDSYKLLLTIVYY